MTEQEFVDRWLESELGMALRGLVNDTDERPRGPNAAGQFALKLEEKVRGRLERMWATAQQPVKVATLNGAQTGVKK